MTDVDLDDEEDYKGNSAPEPWHGDVPAALGGIRLDQALVSMLPEYSRNRLQNWIRTGNVLVNGQPAGVRDKVWGGESITVFPEPDTQSGPDEPEDIPLDIVFEDPAIIIINKPAGLVVHPGNGNHKGTLLNALLHHTAGAADLPRAGIVHRLDKDTSGLMVVAKTLKAHTDLVRQMHGRTVKREYLAVVQGEIDGAGTVNAPLARDPVQRTRRTVHPMGKPAVTHYAIEERFPSATLLRCSLETGRTHQIRVHMKHIGHPLVGDKTYSNVRRGRAMAFPRQALHATRLALNHPYTGERMEWEAPPPDDMETLLMLMRAGGTWGAAD
ncbi:23S rRNA pseudouridine(1911/1915/1917) synthase RluD [Betaproteobacteria bacterium SCN2]|jgi:23S rRNA pseudouridine1911/1915/1917 synthase|nr:23S rRNA pseudouridine(1911/1915/1917) synthase RluD [Betaproteobacteria bacterium SCN2]